MIKLGKGQKQYRRWRDILEHVRMVHKIDIAGPMVGTEFLEDAHEEFHRIAQRFGTETHDVTERG